MLSEHETTLRHCTPPISYGGGEKAAELVRTPLSAILPAVAVLFALTIDFFDFVFLGYDISTSDLLGGRDSLGTLALCGSCRTLGFDCS